MLNKHFSLFLSYHCQREVSLPQSISLRLCEESGLASSEAAIVLTSTSKRAFRLPLVKFSDQEATVHQSVSKFFKMI
jgi:hypothetical protein